MATTEPLSGWTNLMKASFNGEKRSVEALLKIPNDNIDSEGQRAEFVNACDVNGRSSLHLAISSGHSEIIQLLVIAGADVTTKDMFEQTPLIRACIIGNKAVVELLLEYFADDNDMKTKNINLCDREGRNAVFWAAESCHYHIVKLLVDLGGNLTSDKQSAKNTHLMLACMKGNVSKVEQLVDCFVDEVVKASYVNTANKYGYPAIYFAIAKGYDNIVDILIKCGCDLAPKPLIYAAMFGRESVVKIWLDSFTSDKSNTRVQYVNALNDCHTSALYFAAAGGRHEIVDLLVKAGADLGIVDDEGWTPLMAASYNGYQHTVELILSYFEVEKEKESYVNQSDMDGCTAMSLSAKRGHSEIVQLLIQSGGDVNAKDIQSFTPLAIAAVYDEEEVVQVLLDSIPDEREKVEYIDARWNLTCRTPLSLAARTGRINIVEIFINCGADITISCPDYWTPLMGASQSGHTAIVQLLLSHFPDEKSRAEHVNLIYTISERPAIYFASWGGHYKIVEMLLQAGANIIFYDKYLWSPIMRASYDGNLAVVQLLVGWLTDDRVRNEHLNRRNINGISAAQMAQKKGHYNVYNFLMKSWATFGQSQSKQYRRWR